MQRIHVLAPELAGKIAAGEVIERPASVVKELVENSLDAGATEVRVELAAGGKKLVAVRDNGQGMSPQDAAVAFRRHSTSKIAREEDLDRIVTLGFRGEALASISSVSRILLKTSDGEGDRGTGIEREGEKFVGVMDVAFPKGTAIEVRDLFFNLPARRKFLRSDRSELGAIAKYLTNAALASPSVRFVLTHGGRTVLDCPAVAGLRERVFQLYGRDVLDGLMEVDYAETECRVRGFVSRPLKGRGDRNRQFFFVNSRPVKDRTLQAALNQAFSGMLEKDRSAEAFLFLDVPYGEVDVNVHPAKAEVRFRDSQMIFRLVLRGVEKAALRVSGIKEVGGAAAGERVGSLRTRVEEPGLPMPFGREWTVGKRRPEAVGAPAVPEAGLPRPGPLVLGQYLDMYIVAVSEEGLLVVDQHNAHERILYEKFLEIDRTKSWPRKMLLIPEIVELAPSEALAFEENRVLLEDAGFLVEPMGGRSYALKEYPEVFRDGEVREAFLGLLEEVGRTKAAGRREKLLATMACKSAIKAGEPLPMAKMEYLVEELFKAANPTLCPHGRPVVVKLDRASIARGLGRSEKKARLG
jgi:DNA mismatch repair protein MutL